MYNVREVKNMSQEVREPQQQRSIDKKNRIIEAGYELFAKVGYFNTNTSEIAKKAGVSTGIVYGYFHDKRDILIEVLGIYIDNVFYPVFEMFDNITAPVDFDFIITHSIDNAVKVHENNAAIHEALHSLSSTDKTVRDKFMALENDMTVRFVAKLRSLGYDREDIFERVHLAMETVQSYAHEKVFDKHSYIDYDRMRKIVIDMLVSLFKK